MKGISEIGPRSDTSAAMNREDMDPSRIVHCTKHRAYNTPRVCVASIGEPRKTLLRYIISDVDPIAAIGFGRTIAFESSLKIYCLVRYGRTMPMTQYAKANRGGTSSDVFKNKTGIDTGRVSYARIA